MYFYLSQKPFPDTIEPNYFFNADHQLKHWHDNAIHWPGLFQQEFRLTPGGKKQFGFLDPKQVRFVQFTPESDVYALARQLHEICAEQNIPRRNILLHGLDAGMLYPRSWKWYEVMCEGKYSWQELWGDKAPFIEDDLMCDFWKTITVHWGWQFPVDTYSGGPVAPIITNSIGRYMILRWGVYQDLSGSSRNYQNRVPSYDDVYRAWFRQGKRNLMSRINQRM